MNLKGIFSGKGTVGKVVDVIDKVVPDIKEKNQLKFEIYRIIASNMVAKWVRAAIALMFVAVWLFFPDKLEGREKLTEYMLYAIAGYYFLIDRGLNQVKK